MAVTSFEIG